LAAGRFQRRFYWPAAQADISKPISPRRYLQDDISKNDISKRLGKDAILKAPFEKPPDKASLEFHLMIYPSIFASPFGPLEPAWQA
jgi:hypothetical protein